MLNFLPRSLLQWQSKEVSSREDGITSKVITSKDNWEIKSRLWPQVYSKSLPLGVRSPLLDLLLQSPLAYVYL